MRPRRFVGGTHRRRHSVEGGGVRAGAVNRVRNWTDLTGPFINKMSLDLYRRHWVKTLSVTRPFPPWPRPERRETPEAH